MDATIDWSDAAHRTWDAIVVGAGPAGSMAARELSRAGLAVLLVDKASFPRDKVCGCCLNERGLATLNSVGLGGLPGQSGARPLRGFVLAAAGRQAELRLAGNISLSRGTLDTGLIAAAVEAGTCFLPATRADLVEHNRDQLSVQLARGDARRSVAGRVVVAADGLGGRLLAGKADARDRVRDGSRVGAGVIADVQADVYEPGKIFMSCAAGGYVGLVRLEDGRLDIAAALDPRLVRRSGGLGSASAGIMAAAGLQPVEGVDRLPWRGTTFLTRRPQSVAAERLFAVGDAAGYVEPFTGEGIAWALAAGVAVAPIVQQACGQWQPHLIDQWNRVYHLFRRRQWQCRLLATLLRHPAMTAQAVQLLCRAPVLATPLLGSLRSRRSAPSLEVVPRSNNLL